MIDQTTMQGMPTMMPAMLKEDPVTLAETLPPVVMLLGGVPALTVLVMTAVRYVASGTI